MNKEWGGVLIFMGILVLICFFIISFVKERPSDETVKETLVSNTNNPEDNFSHNQEMHWTHMPLKYFISNEKKCGSYETGQIKRAFNEIEAATNNLVYFEKINNSEEVDIILNCSFLEDCYKKEVDAELSYTIITESICAYTLGLAEITEYKDKKILKAKVELIGLAGLLETKGTGVSGFSVGDCGYPATEIHEILHTFGYEHINNPYSIMSPTAEEVGGAVYSRGDCFDSIHSIDETIINDLISTYS